MESRLLIADNLRKSAERVLERVEDMRGLALVSPFPEGGCHTLWVLGHLATIEGLVIHGFMQGLENPLAHWEPIFDGPAPPEDPGAYPGFDEVLATCRRIRQSTLDLVDSLEEADLDRVAARVPAGWEATFGTWRLCLQYVADHGYMHRGQLAVARRAAGIRRMWV